MPLTWFVERLHAGEQELGCLAAHRSCVLGHHGDGGINQVCHREIVEADEGDSLLQGPSSQSTHRPHGDEVLCAEDRCGC